MTKEQLSGQFFKATSNISDATLELYEALHPLGQPQTEMNNKVGSLFKSYTNTVNAELDGMKESIKEFSGK